jgi:PAT family beta-lactamase induction signal transducer AmpG
MKNFKSPWTWVPSLYFAEGLPYVAVMTISLVLYKQLGLSNAEITFYTSWLYLPWVIKPLWSPFIDLIKTKRWWIVSMQLLIGAAFGGVAFTIPTSFWLQGTLFFFWVMAFSSATHDIAADGFYMLGLDEHNQAWFVGIRSTFYRLATIFGQGVLVMIAGNLQVIWRNSISLSWSLMFYGVAGLFIALWLWHSYILPRPKEDESRSSNAADIWSGLKNMATTFVTKFPLKEVIIGILFMLLYRMPEGLLAKVSALFLIDNVHKGGLGLSPQEYGLVQGTVGVVGLTLGGILGGIAAGRDGLKRWLWPMVCAITLPDIVYVYMSYAMPQSLFVVNVCVFFEQFGYGFGFTAYMLYLIYYSQGAYKTSHYALCTAFMALSMMIPGLFAGALQEAVGYRAFFIIVMICCAVTFLVTAFLKIDPQFGKKEEEISS